MDAKKWDVVVLGGINTDFMIRSDALPAPGQTVQGDLFCVRPGGKGANQAVAAARLGAKVALIGRVGNEPRGKELLSGLRKKGIDLRYVSVDPKAPSGAAIIAIDAHGEKQISAALGANYTMRLKHIREAAQLIASAKVLLMQFEAPMPCVVLAAEIARKHGTRVILDPAPPTKIPAKLFKLLDVIRPNSDEAEKITGRQIQNRNDARAAAKLLLKRGVQVVAMESGDGGDLILTETEEHYLPRLKVKTVDATGAGDAFAGAFAVGLAEGLPLPRICQLANATAALSTTKVGAQEALPTRRKVANLINPFANIK
jgi:ribokinase